MIQEKPKSEPKIAVLIDFENVGATSIQSLFDRLSERGTIVLKRAYADWGKASSGRDQILKLGIEPIYVFRSPTKRKNTSDIRLTIDAVELLHTSEIDTFVFVSSDSDFVPLVNKLRSLGKNVFVAGDKTKAGDTLKTACNEYFDLEEKNVAEAINLQIEKMTETKPVSLNQKVKLPAAKKPEIESNMAQQIDQAWLKRASMQGESIAGPTAADEVVKILRVKNLKTSVYKTLQGVLDASQLLTKHWHRNKNTIVRK